MGCDEACESFNYQVFQWSDSTFDPPWVVVLGDSLIRFQLIQWVVDWTFPLKFGWNQLRSPIAIVAVVSVFFFSDVFPPNTKCDWQKWNGGHLLALLTTTLTSLVPPCTFVKKSVASLVLSMTPQIVARQGLKACIPFFFRLVLPRDWPMRVLSKIPHETHRSNCYPHYRSSAYLAQRKQNVWAIYCF